MYRQCSTEEGARRQQQLIRSLLDLMGSKSYARITVEDISASVGITRKSFYRYFDCKDDCLTALVDQAIQGFPAYYPHASTTPRPDRDFLVHYFTYWAQQRLLLEALCRNQLTSLLYERTAISIRQEQAGRAAPADSEHVYDQLVFMVCGTTGLIIGWHMSGYQRTAEQMADALSQLIAAE